MVAQPIFNEILDSAINNSLIFEEYMDKTDFNSYFYDEPENDLITLKQDVKQYTIFKKNIATLQKICDKCKKQGCKELPENPQINDLEKWFLYQLFDSKSKRLAARLVTKDDGKVETNEHKFEEAANQLHITLSKIEEHNIKKEIWSLLFCNDLSICYSGLKNSALSLGYSNKAISAIKEKYWSDFLQKCYPADLHISDKINLETNQLEKSKINQLHLVAVYNRATAERRSDLLSEAEKSFKIIVNCNEPLDSLKFNYQSAILELGRLFIDQGRGKEAAELLEELLPTDKKRQAMQLSQNDYRYWDARLQYISSLIDQTKYSSASKFLKCYFEKNGSWSLIGKHRVTFQGFSALNCLFRCHIEKLRNRVEINKNEKDEVVHLASIIKSQIPNMDARSQTEPKVEAYRYLGDLYSLLSEECKCCETSEIDTFRIESLNNYLSAINGSEIKSEKFVKDKQIIEKSTNNCFESDLLFKIMCLICEGSDFKNLTPDEQGFILSIFHSRIKLLCENKSELFKIKQSADKICEHSKKINKNLPIDEKEIEDEIKQRFLDKGLNGAVIRHRLDVNEKRFDSVLFHRLNLSKCENSKILAELIILRRWNSFSPGLFRRDSVGSLGGGYFIRINRQKLELDDKAKDKINKTTENIVVDPGYNFLQNFSNEGFSIDDIDTIIVTHAHLDHCADLAPIMDLIFQINKRSSRCPKEENKNLKKRINLCLSKAAYRKFNNHISDWKDLLENVVILENLKAPWCPVSDLEISVVKTPHDDLGHENTTGIKIKSKNNDFCFGITGDTPYCQELLPFFSECDVLCLHLGSIKYAEIGYNEKIYDQNEDLRKISGDELIKQFRKTYFKSNHLLFWGAKKLIEECNPNESKLVIVSEFGEELKYKLRTDLCSKLSNDVTCLPGDIGLYLRIEKDKSNVISKRIRCNFCEEFVEKKVIKTFSHGRSDSIQYICDSCEQTLSNLQKHSIIDHRDTRH